MAINPLFRSSPVRLMGLSSGMDTDSIIRQTLRLHQLKIDSQMRSRTLLEWRQQSLNGIRDELTDFRRSFLTVMGQNAMRLSSVYNTTVASVNSRNNSAAVSVATTIDASPGTLKIGRIASLAKNTSVTTTGSASRYGNGFRLTDKLGDIRVPDQKVAFDSAGNADVTVAITRLANDGDAITPVYRPVTVTRTINLNKDDSDDDLKTKLDNAFAAEFSANGITYTTFGAEGNTPMTISVNGKDIMLAAGDASADLVNKVNAANSQNYKELVFDGDEVKVNIGGNEVTLNRALMSPSDLHAALGVDFSSTDTLFVNINGYEVMLKDTDTVEGLVSKVNEAGANAVTAGRLNFDSFGNTSIRINGVTIGLNKDMTIEDMLNRVNASSAGVTMSYDRMADKFTIESNRGGGGPMTVWGLDAFGISSHRVEMGTMAAVQINGEWVVKDSNTFDFRGAKITLHYTTDAPDYNPAADDITVTFRRDATEAVEKIKTFVDAYNVIINKLENLVRERKNSSERLYTPLTDEEKSVMSEKQIEEWEEIAKKGLLRNDAGIQNLINSLRGALFEQVTAAGLTPSQIGLSTGRWDSGTGGQIVIDETKLRAALESDPDRVMNVFMGGAEETQSQGRGLLWRMEDLMNGYMNNSQSTTLNNLENSIRRTNEQMEKLQQKMYEEEDKLYKRFAALETALSKIQSQTDWLFAMLDAGKK